MHVKSVRILKYLFHSHVLQLFLFTLARCVYKPSFFKAAGILSKQRAVCFKGINDTSIYWKAVCKKGREYLAGKD